MKTLPEICVEATFADRRSLRSALDYAEAFTDRFDACAGMSPAQRESELLSIQFPTVLRPPEPGDLLAGRICYGLVGISPEPCGLGYYCVSGAMESWLEENGRDSEEGVRIARLINRWRGRTTGEKVRAAFPPALAAALPRDSWFDASGVAFPLYRMAGSILDYGKLLSLGLDGVEENSGTGAWGRSTR